MIEPPEKEALSRAEFWQRIAAFSFGLWSLMIPFGIWMLGNVFERAARTTLEQASELVLFNRRFEVYVLQVERRLTLIEERQGRVLHSLETIDEILAARKVK